MILNVLRAHRATEITYIKNQPKKIKILIMAKAYHDFRYALRLHLNKKKKITVLIYEFTRKEYAFS